MPKALGTLEKVTARATPKSNIQTYSVVKLDAVPRKVKKNPMKRTPNPTAQRMPKRSPKAPPIIAESMVPKAIADHNAPQSVMASPRSCRTCETSMTM